MSNVLSADIPEYLQTLLLLKAKHELEPVRQLALKHEALLKHYPHAAQQVQDLLIPVAKQNYTALPERLRTALKNLEAFHQSMLSLRHESSRWGTEAKCDAIQEKVTLLVLPFDELNYLKKSHLQRARAAEQEERERQHQEDERLRQEAEEAERQRLETEERRLREIVVEERKALVGFGIFICILFGISTFTIIGAKHKPTDLKSVVEAPTAEPTVIVKQKKPEKIDKRVSLESYLKGIKNGCEFNSDVAILTPVLEAVKVSTGPNENDYDYTLPPDNKMVKKYSDLYKSIPVVAVKQGYFEVSADINGKFYGLTASKLIRGYGNEKVVSFFTLVFDSPHAESLLKKKIDFKTQWYELGHRELGAVFYVEDGKTYMTCDWSN